MELVNWGSGLMVVGVCGLVILDEVLCGFDWGCGCFWCCGGVVRWVVLFVNVFFVFLSGAGG